MGVDLSIAVSFLLIALPSFAGTVRPDINCMEAGAFLTYTKGLPRTQITNEHVRRYESVVNGKYGIRGDEDLLGGEMQGTISRGRVPQNAGLKGVAKFKPGAVVAVKRYQMDIRFIAEGEVKLMDKIAPVDPKGLFVSTALDPESDVVVMELLDGYRPLHEWLPHADARGKEKVGAQLVEALKVLQKANVVHGDLKPDNIMVNADGKIKVMDLGHAAEVDKYPPMGNRGGANSLYFPPEAKFKPAKFSTDTFSVQKIFEYDLGIPYPY